MKLRTIAPMCASVVLVSCSTLNEPLPPRSELAPDPLPTASPISGRYDVKGFTIPDGSHEKRKVAGTVVLAVHEDRYTATYDLATSYRGTEGLMEARVIGTGEGRVEGGRLIGNAETQAVVSMVPGLSPLFAYAPRLVVRRVLSTSEVRALEDGRVEFAIERVEAGDVGPFVSNRTRLSGVRVGVAPGRESLPDVATVSVSPSH